jgi:hypothetical protein
VVSILDKGNGFADKSEGQLRAISGVERVRRVASEAGELRFEVLPQGSGDLRPLLFRAAVDHGFTLVGLSREGQGLEQIFRELTTSDDAAAPSTTAAASSNSGAAANP